MSGNNDPNDPNTPNDSGTSDEEIPETAEFIPLTFHETPYKQGNVERGQGIDDRTSSWGRTIRATVPPGGTRWVRCLEVSLPNDYIYPTTIGLRCDSVIDVLNIVRYRIRWGSGGTNHEMLKPQGTYYVGCTRLVVELLLSAPEGVAPYTIESRVSAWVPTVANNV